MTTICICGAGTMGAGIAQVCAAAGFETILYDISPETVEKAREKMNTDLEKLVEKQKMAPSKRDAVFQNIKFTSNPDDCRAQLVIEAVIEKADVKTALFNQLADINDKGSIFASNTSSLSISTLAKTVKRPEMLAGLHFFNPAPIMKLVEVVKGEQTPDHVIEKLVSFTRALGKEPVLCRDAPGFIVNRVARPFYIESLRIMEEGKVVPETIDKLLEGRGFRMGPFRLMDLIGNDVNYAVSCSVYEQLGRPERLRPSQIQKEKVEKGELGKKAGKGYYHY
ncbi:MAG TPA: 3-hydroxyacyl-CoA dehydrogenase NAD-binding domain-containing protein [Flavisolibacter sp.]|nr:3-hydroxyacyl-CoA dehydrogenase NAD-binding domain-containing protein [Flavisolibacter sp.]